MGILELLTLVLVLLKAFGVIAWSWWLVFVPLAIALVFYILILSVFGTTFFLSWKKIFKDSNLRSK
ncbi:hypothetical protein [Oceanobacillus kimchii]|uniref:Transmembrane Fragile-X-F protein n=1 Tax=Oceanobacillus kimchii TaxID=746691 RepID=A0ABQ5TKN2_9BACI|nr:hypothetical protein [Oceanobacillus kimchii]GLO66254.1 hypothetical protein MACH08_20380 [Oceanobacillus kimchii]